MDEMVTDKIMSFHAHVYFDAETTGQARALREAIEQRFDGVMTMGRFHEKPVGPHPCWSYQVAFMPEHFAEIVQWLSLNRGGLSVFVHPETGDVMADHTDYVMWLGKSHELALGALG